MNNDLISREALKEEIVKLCERINANNGITVPTLAFTRIIDNAPPVTPKQGEWIMESKLYGGFGDSVLAITCSICKESFVYRGMKHNFCPKCGADMRKGGAEE